MVRVARQCTLLSCLGSKPSSAELHPLGSYLILAQKVPPVKVRCLPPAVPPPVNFLIIAWLSGQRSLFPCSCPNLTAIRLPQSTHLIAIDKVIGTSVILSKSFVKIDLLYRNTQYPINNRGLIKKGARWRALPGETRVLTCPTG